MKKVLGCTPSVFTVSSTFNLVAKVFVTRAVDEFVSTATGEAIFDTIGLALTLLPASLKLATKTLGLNGPRQIANE